MRCTLVVLMMIIAIIEGVKNPFQSVAVAPPIVMGIVKIRHDLETFCKEMKKASRPTGSSGVISESERTHLNNMEEIKRLCVIMDI